MLTRKSKENTRRTSNRTLFSLRTKPKLQKLREIRYALERAEEIETTETHTMD